MYSGLSRLPLDKKLQILSEAETKALCIAIKLKKEEISELDNNITQDNEYTSLSRKQKAVWYKYYEKKILFYKSQQNTKWKDWPCKRETTKQKSKSQWKKERKIRKEAEDAVKNGTVRNLTNEEVPPEVISLLAKGLGFVPTPEINIPQVRLDGRKLTNKLVNKAYFEEKTAENSSNEKVPDLTEDYQTTTKQN